MSDYIPLNMDSMYCRRECRERCGCDVAMSAERPCVKRGKLCPRQSETRPASSTSSRTEVSTVPDPSTSNPSAHHQVVTLYVCDECLERPGALKHPSRYASLHSTPCTHLTGRWDAKFGYDERSVERRAVKYVEVPDA